MRAAASVHCIQFDFSVGATRGRGLPEEPSGEEKEKEKEEEKEEEEKEEDEEEEDEEKEE